MKAILQRPRKGPARHQIDRRYYPIVYVRGYAMTSGERESTFNDAYYGFSANSVERRDVSPENGYFAVDVFEGQLIRFMKQHGYIDAANGGLDLIAEDTAGGVPVNPSRSIFVSRFYDADHFSGRVRSIEDHAGDLKTMVMETIPQELADRGVDTDHYKVILIAHSMGGLVCRTFIQTLLPRDRVDPKDVVHRLVTMGTPHGGIELGAVPDVIEQVATKLFNPFDSGIFRPEKMRDYLSLGTKTASGDELDALVKTLGDPKSPYAFPPQRCLCVIGSDHQSYNAVRAATGNHSDGLVKQDRAFITGSYTARVHRAHSGPRGIVNSYESFENIRRFLFGDVKVRLELADIDVHTDESDDVEIFEDFEVAISIRGTGVYLHQRKQDPCENAMRFPRDRMPPALELHTGFLSSKLSKDNLLHLLLKLAVREHRTRKGLLWDREYPDRPIYSESIEVRIGDFDPKRPGPEVQYRWFSDTTSAASWTDCNPDAAGRIRIALRPSDAFSAVLAVTPSGWPDGETQDEAPTPV